MYSRSLASAAQSVDMVLAIRRARTIDSTSVFLWILLAMSSMEDPASIPETTSSSTALIAEELNPLICFEIPADVMILSIWSWFGRLKEIAAPAVFETWNAVLCVASSAILPSGGPETSIAPCSILSAAICDAYAMAFRREICRSRRGAASIAVHLPASGSGSFAAYFRSQSWS